VQGNPPKTWMSQLSYSPCPLGVCSLLYYKSESRRDCQITCNLATRGKTNALTFLVLFSKKRTIFLAFNKKKSCQNKNLKFFEKNS
jgi:hypothetical protein